MKPIQKTQDSGGGVDQSEMKRVTQRSNEVNVVSPLDTLILPYPRDNGVLSKIWTLKSHPVHLHSLNKRSMQICHATDCRSYTERRTISHVNTAHYFLFKYIYLLCIYICVFVSPCVAHNCDFKGSGLDLDGTGVQPVYLSCTSGRVEWHFPRAALRILLQLPGKGREFHGCIKASEEIEGARLFVEGHRSLVPLYAKDDGKPRDRIRCFTSYKGQVALYLEAEPSTGFKDVRAAFDYDLQPLTKGEIYDPIEDCRPCSSSELVRLYCSADFAARGLIISTEDDPLLQQTKVTFAASRVYQQTSPVFSKTRLPQGSNELEPKNNHLHSATSSTNDRTHQTRLIGNLFLPLECGARRGLGEFLVLGTVRLGQPVLRCAPRIEEWSEIVHSAQDMAHCILET